MTANHPEPASLRLTLPLPPSINSQYVMAGKRRVLSKSARAYKKDATAKLERLHTDGTIHPNVVQRFGASLIGVYMTFFFETPMRRDLDGGLKIALDTLAESLGFDDRSVVDLHLVKQIDPLHPRLEVEVETIQNWSFDRSYVYLGSADSEAEAPGT